MHPQSRRHSALRILKVIALSSAALLLNLLLLQLVVWKEDPMFWLNAGGYPVWLRNEVEVLFYPLLFTQFFVLFFSSILQIRTARNEGPARPMFYATIMLLWLMFAAVLTLLLWNNIENLVNSRPLHYHKARNF